jgi:hypothetical protein
VRRDAGCWWHNYALYIHDVMEDEGKGIWLGFDAKLKTVILRKRKSMLDPKWKEHGVEHAAKPLYCI